LSCHTYRNAPAAQHPKIANRSTIAHRHLETTFDSAAAAIRWWSIIRGWAVSAACNPADECATDECATNQRTAYKRAAYKRATDQSTTTD
jgi:hypothetical protein